MVAVVGEDMLLIDDEDVLPEVPDEDEAALVTELGSDGLGRLEAALLAATSGVWRKGAMIVSEALQAVGQFPPRGGGWVDLATRRLGELVRSGRLDAQGDVRRPRWSEFRQPSS